MHDSGVYLPAVKGRLTHHFVFFRGEFTLRNISVEILFSTGLFAFSLKNEEEINVYNEVRTN